MIISRSRILVTTIAIALTFMSISFASISHASSSNITVDNTTYYYQGYNGNSTFYMVWGLLEKCIPACIWHSEDRIPVLNSFSNDTVHHGLSNGYCSITHNNALLLNEGGANAIGFYLNEATSTGY